MYQAIHKRACSAAPEETPGWCPVPAHVSTVGDVRPCFLLGFVTCQQFATVCPVLPLGRAFAEAGNVSVRVPVASSPPEPSQNSSLCLGGSPAVASPSREGDAGDGGWGGGLPSAAAELRYQHHVWGKHGGMFSGRERSRLWFYFGSQRRAKTPGAP